MVRLIRRAVLENSSAEKWETCELWFVTHPTPNENVFRAFPVVLFPKLEVKFPFLLLFTPLLVRPGWTETLLQKGKSRNWYFCCAKNVFTSKSYLMECFFESVQKLFPFKTCFCAAKKEINCFATMFYNEHVRFDLHFLFVLYWKCADLSSYCLQIDKKKTYYGSNS